MIKNLSIIIVTYNPDYNVLNRCLDSIIDNLDIYIIDNSENLNHELINNFSKKKIKIVKSKNLGNGYGINLGIKLSTTKYILYLDVDTILTDNFIDDLLVHIKKISDFGVIGPALQGYQYNKEAFLKKSHIDDNYFEMNFIQGAIMLINKEKIIENNISFDENIFLYWEEIDFYFQCNQKKLKIFLVNNLIGYHKGGSSINKKIYEDIELNRNWHYMWSKFYYYKKNFGIYIAYKKTIAHFIKSIIKYTLYTIVKNPKKKIYFERLSGLFNSYLGKNSWRRPKP